MQHNVQTLLHVVKRIPLAAGRQLLRMCFRLFLSPKIFKINIQSLNISHPCKLIVTQSLWSACFKSPTPLGSLYLPQHSLTSSPGLKEDPSSETQGQSVGPGEKARRKFSSTGGRAPGYRLSPDHFQTVK